VLTLGGTCKACRADGEGGVLDEGQQGLG